MTKLSKNKKGFTIGDLSNIAISFGVGIIVIVIMSIIVQDVRDDHADDNINLSNPGSWNVAYNSTDLGLGSLNTLSSFLPLIALAAVGAVVVGIVIRFFLNRGNQ